MQKNCKFRIGQAFDCKQTMPALYFEDISYHTYLIKGDRKGLQDLCLSAIQDDRTTILFPRDLDFCAIYDAIYDNKRRIF